MLLLLALALPSETLAERFPPPGEAKRAAYPAEHFATWVRERPLLPPGTPVRLFDGRRKWRQDVHAAVFDLDIGDRDLQQCADFAYRLHAEHRRERGAELCFRFTSGGRAPFARWAAGERPRVRGRRVSWVKTARPSRSQASFRTWLDTIYTYAGSASLHRDTRPVKTAAPGDVFVQPGFPGHVVLVLDVARDASKTYLLLGQSYMPAQTPHVLAGPVQAWFPAPAPDERFVTPEWSFPTGEVRRLPADMCR